MSNELEVYEYPEFEDWFLEIENYGTRSERAYESFNNMQSELAQAANLILWLTAAFEAGRSTVYNKS